MDDSEQSCGFFVRSLRLAAGITQEELAARSGISVRTISNLERNVGYRPRRDTLHLLASALALTPEQQAQLVAATKPPPKSFKVTRLCPANHDGTALVPPNLTTPLIGREQAIGEIQALVRDHTTRLITLTGTGGVGKTHLAIAVAAGVAGEGFPDGVVFVPFAAVGDPSLVAATIVRRLGCHEPTGCYEPEALLRSYLRHRRLLLVLDNLEHLVSAAPVIADLLISCRGLTILVTSRARLHLHDEIEYSVAPLPLPADGLPLEALATVPSVALFIERVQRVVRGFDLTRDNAPAIADICRRLDGLPLALELAAARCKLLTPAALLARLNHRLHTLARGPWDVPLRQQTLRATIAWSYQLLPPDARQLFRRLAVFVNGFSIEAAEKVCCLDDNMPDVLESLSTLTDHHLVHQTASQSGTEGRLDMLETIREYALEELQAGGELSDMQQAHAVYLQSLAEQADMALIGAQQVVWLQWFDQEADNLRAALRWAIEGHNAGIALALGGAMARYWHMRGHLREGRFWLETLVTRFRAVAAAPQRHQALFARASLGLGRVAAEQGDLDRASACYNECLSIYRCCGDTRGVAHTLNNLGEVARQRGDYARALPLYEESLALKRLLGDSISIITTLNNIGLTRIGLGDIEGALQTLDDCLRMSREVGNIQWTARALANQADALRYRGEIAHATELLEESLRLRRRLADGLGCANALGGLGDIAHAQGAHDRAFPLYLEAMDLYHQLGVSIGVAQGLEAAAAVICADGSYSTAMRLLGAASRIREEIGIQPSGEDSRRREESLTQMRVALGEELLMAELHRGRQLSAGEAVALASMYQLHPVSAHSLRRMR